MSDPLVVIVGPTASGKSHIAMQLAQKYNGQVICADARTIYKDMDIGTAKPTAQDQRKVVHHLLDIAEVDQPITVADFSAVAKKSIAIVTTDEYVPIIAGGSGMYIDSLIYDFSFAPKADTSHRAGLQTKTVEELQKILIDKAIPLPFNNQNPRHLIRHIETYGQLGSRGPIKPSVVIIGLSVERSILKTRIIARTEEMFKLGLVDEVEQLVKRYGWDTILGQTIGYQEFRPYFEGVCSLEEVKQSIISDTVKLAKRQMTWFRRNKDIHWATDDMAKIEDIVTTFLNK